MLRVSFFANGESLVPLHLRNHSKLSELLSFSFCALVPKTYRLFHLLQQTIPSFSFSDNENLLALKEFDFSFPHEPCHVLGLHVHIELVPPITKLCGQQRWIA
jgi:hypothetical protein